MNGWTGKILSINITTGKTDVIVPSDFLYQTYIGGKGLAGYYLKDHITKEWNDAEMPLLFFTGPLVDTPSPTSGRMTIMSRSPLTGTVGDTSVGGKLGVQIKRAGWDGIIITGKRDALSGIVIKDGDISISDAEKYKGSEVSAVLSGLEKNGSSAVVGPAAENGVLFANISVDGHFFSGRNGLGLVMAEKNIKYISISGSGKTEIFNKEEVMKAREEIFRLVAASPILKGELGISEFGTGALYDLLHLRRMMHTENFKKTSFENAPDLNAFAYKTKFETKKYGCSGCHIICKKKDLENNAMPEFETMSHFTALIENNDIDLVVKLNALCNELGMDTISAAATISCYKEITGASIDREKIIQLCKEMAYSIGEGEILKLGSSRYACHAGKPEASMSVKGLELPAYDPRGAYGMALAYAMSTRGGCHLRSYPISHEILRKPVATDRFSFSGKARIIKLSEDLNAVVDSLTACKFIFFASSLEEYARAFYGVTGIATDAQGLLKTGERIYYQERMMNMANGFSAKDDDLPERFFKEEGSSGKGIEVKPLKREEFLEARGNYYKIRGLDKNGIPTKEKCSELGLEWNM